eukprot:1922443-Rhodomonas_salina.1
MSLGQGPGIFDLSLAVPVVLTKQSKSQASRNTLTSPAVTVCPDQVTVLRLLGSQAPSPACAAAAELGAGHKAPQADHTVTCPPLPVPLAELEHDSTGLSHHGIAAASRAKGSRGSSDQAATALASAKANHDHIKARLIKGQERGQSGKAGGGPETGG